MIEGCNPNCILATGHPYDCETDPYFGCRECGVSLRFHDDEHGSCGAPGPMETCENDAQKVQRPRNDAGKTGAR